MTEPETILVTGGAGYVGSVCVSQLLKLGYAVHIVDDLSTGHRDTVPPAAVFHPMNVGDKTALASLLQTVRFHAVFHFAAKAIVSESVADPDLYHRTNVEAGIAMLETLRKSGIKKFVFSSSCAVYGVPAKMPIQEDTPKHPVNPYGETKLKFEQILETYSLLEQWSGFAFRYFNAAGATDHLGERHHPETHLIPNLLEGALGERDTVNIYGHDYPTPDGTCVRDYIHVLDIADAHILALQQPPQPGFRAFNIGTGNGYSVREVVKAVEEVTGRRLKVQISERRAGDPPVLCADPQKLKKELGWQPKASELKTIIQSAYDYKTRR